MSLPLRFFATLRMTEGEGLAMTTRIVTPRSCHCEEIVTTDKAISLQNSIKSMPSYSILGMYDID
ncbi:MAG: hypothetical protein V1832_03260 [Nitrospirota bacterium]